MVTTPLSPFEGATETAYRKINARLGALEADSGVTAGSYGGAAVSATITVNANGKITSASDTTIEIPASQVTGLADVATSGDAGDLTGLADVATSGDADDLTAGLRVIAAGTVNLDTDPATSTTITAADVDTNDLIFTQAANEAAKSLDSAVHVSSVGSGSFDLGHGVVTGTVTFNWIAIRTS